MSPLPRSHLGLPQTGFGPLPGLYPIRTFNMPLIVHLSHEVCSDSHVSYVSARLCPKHFAYLHSSNSPQYPVREESTVVIPVLQTRRLRHRGLREFLGVPQVVNHLSRMHTQVLESVLPTTLLYSLSVTSQ